MISHGALCWHWRLTEMPAGAKGLEVSVCSRPALADVNGYFLHDDEKHSLTPSHGLSVRIPPFSQPWGLSCSNKITECPGNRHARAPAQGERPLQVSVPPLRRPLQACTAAKSDCRTVAPSKFFIAIPPSCNVSPWPLPPTRPPATAVLCLALATLVLGCPPAAATAPGLSELKDSAPAELGTADGGRAEEPESGTAVLLFRSPVRTWQPKSVSR